VEKHGHEVNLDFLGNKKYAEGHVRDKGLLALDFDGERVVSIQDFLYARYAMDGVDLSPLSPKALSQ
jgi:hypothetical protein